MSQRDRDAAHPPPARSCRAVAASACAILPAVALIAGALPAYAGETDWALRLEDLAEGRGGDPLRVVGVFAIWENDGAYVKPIDDADRHYTNGLKIDLALRGGPIPRIMSALPGFGAFEDPRFGGGVALTQLMFTGFDISEPDPPEGDRPYAGHLGLTFYGQRSDRWKLDHAEIQLGVLGPLSGAQAVQTFVHSAVPRQTKPRGWSTQLNDEPTINAGFIRRWRTPRAEIAMLEAELIPELGARVGTVRTSVDAGLTARIGLFLPDDFGSPTSISAFRDVAGSWGDGTGQDWGVYAFARAGASFKAHDVFLDGNVFSNSRSVDKRHAVAEAQVGVVGRYGKLELGYALTFKTQEFANQRGTDSFGSFFAGLIFEF